MKTYSKVECVACGWAGSSGYLTTRPDNCERCPKCQSTKIFSPRDLEEFPELRHLTPSYEIARAAAYALHAQSHRNDTCDCGASL